MYSFRDVHLLPHFLKRQRIKTPEEQSQVPHSYFFPFNFSLVELFIQKKLSIKPLQSKIHVFRHEYFVSSKISHSSVECELT